MFYIRVLQRIINYSKVLMAFSKLIHIISCFLYLQQAEQAFFGVLQIFGCLAETTLWLHLQKIFQYTHTNVSQRLATKRAKI